MRADLIRSDSLAVLVDGDACGVIRRGPSLTYDFTYAAQWIEEQRPAISLALPADGEQISADAARAYFGGLLPEGSARRQIAERAGIDELDDVSLLALLGRECAGAITIVPIDAAGGIDPDRGARSTQWLNHDELAQLVTSLRVSGSDDSIDSYSVSLAGAQLKRGVVVDLVSNAIGIPHGDELSSHILKLEPPSYPGMAAVEHCMQQLARDIGIRASSTSLRSVGAERVLLVERYDRVNLTDTGHPTRLHQEDMCQALGILSSHKYERFAAGRALGPTASDIVALLRTHARPSIAQVQDFLTLFWFNVVIGNVDAHAKNYSLLYSRDMRQFSVAPLYDAICVSAFHAHHTRVRRIAEEPLSMNIGGQTRFWQLTQSDVSRFAQSLRIGPSYALRRLSATISAVETALSARIDESQAGVVTEHPVLEVVRHEIQERCAFLHDVVSR